MHSYLFLLIFLPLIFMIASMMLSRKHESELALLAITNGVVLLVLSLSGGLILWFNQYTSLFQKHLTLYSSPDFDFSISYYFDKVTWIFSVIGALIFILVAKYSETYMHRDEGYKRYFVILNIFIIGYMITVAAGNFETLFIGWEVLGMCSFLLISFYRDRYLPIKNGLKVVSFYRLGDVCLIVALWACHHVFHKNISFEEIDYIVQNHSTSSLLLFTLMMILIAAMIKSAVFPFSSWLPRAMEGPTSSSAIFYGSLSIHLGIFLLIRTYSLWADVMIFKILLVIFGMLTVFIAISIARVQSTVKTQIAYASLSQIGMMMIEVAAGWHWLALIHFACNAIYRTHQLLISPSVMNYQIHDMFFHYQKPEFTRLSRLKNTLYVLNLKEWNLDSWHINNLWEPFKTLGKSMNFMKTKFATTLFLIIFVFGLLYTGVEHHVHPKLDNIITHLFAISGLALILKSFASRRSGFIVWFYLILGQGFVTLSVFVNEHVPIDRIVIYLSGITIAAFLGFYALTRLYKIDNDLSLSRWHHYTSKKPNDALLLLLACLALLGFPFTPTFLGIDLLYTHLNPNQYVMVCITSLSFIFIELAALRLYARLCLGLPKEGEGEQAWRSS